MTVIINILLAIIAIFLFSLIIFVHELGHFAAAKLVGVQVNEFAIGMGPKLFKRQKGETLYSLRALPIGGFCAMEGEDEESDKEGSFSTKSIPKRMLIVSAGAIMNIILAFVLMFTLVVQQDKFASTTVAKFMDGAVTNSHGLKEGDTITSINGYKIMSYKDIGFMMAINRGEPVDISVVRDGKALILNGVQFASKESSSGKKVTVRDFYVLAIEKSFTSVPAQTFSEVISTIRGTYFGFIGMITGRFGFSEISGPVGMINAVSDAASIGLEVNLLQAINNIILMIGVFTISCGILNLMPFPALDGGRLFFLLVEAITRKPINRKYEGMVHAVGFALLILLMLVLTVNDFWGIFSKSSTGG